MYSGGVGGGKTWAFCQRSIAMCSDSPFFGDMSGNVGLMGRYGLTDFYKTTFPELKKWIPKQWIRKFYKKDGILELVNESVIHFTHFDDMEHLHSYNIGWAGADQLEQIPETVFKGVAFERLRLKHFNRFDIKGNMVNPPVEIPFHGFFATCNPKRGWVYDCFVKNEQCRVSNDRDTRAKYNDSYKMIEVSTFDNALFLPKQYISLQKENLSKREYDRRIKGSWDAFEGAIFEDFNNSHVNKTNVVPHPSWKIYIGIDHGGTGSVPSNRSVNVTGVIFFAVEEHSGTWPSVHIFDELFLHSSTIEETVAAIDGKLKAIAVQQKMYYPTSETMSIGNRAGVRTWRCDPSMNKRNGDQAETIMETYIRNAHNRDIHMPITNGDNDIESSITKISWMLRKGIITVNPKCRNFINEIKSYEYAKDSEKPSKGQSDHLLDALKYVLSALPLWLKNFRIDTAKSREELHMENIRRQGMHNDNIFGARYGAVG